MTQQPFNRPGAIDLSALKRQAPPEQPPGGAPGQPGQPGPAAPGGAPAGGTAYSVQVADEQSFQQVVEASMTAPVVLVFHARSQSPESTRMADDVVSVVDGHGGRFLAASVDIDAMPQIAQAMQIPQVPLMLVLVEGRPATQPIPGPLSTEDLRAVFDQLAQQLTAQGITGRHQPRQAAPADGEEGGEESPTADPRFAAAQDALAAGDIDTAVAEYQRLVDANPADDEAAAGLAMAKVLERTRGVDLEQARRAAADAPDDVAAQTLVADCDLLGGHVEDAFQRLVDFVRRSSGEDRDTAREHLVALFGAVGNDDPRVQRARQALAAALF